MFPRAAIAIATLLVSIFVVIGFVGSRFGQDAHCHRELAQPYERLLERMQQLADAGETEQLRTLITRARQRRSEIASPCIDPEEGGVYGRQVWELTK